MVVKTGMHSFVVANHAGTHVSEDCAHQYVRLTQGNYTGEEYVDQDAKEKCTTAYNLAKNYSMVHVPVNEEEELNYGNAFHIMQCDCRRFFRGGTCPHVVAASSWWTTYGKVPIVDASGGDSPLPQTLPTGRPFKRRNTSQPQATQERHQHYEERGPLPTVNDDEPVHTDPTDPFSDDEATFACEVCEEEYTDAFFKDNDVCVAKENGAATVVPKSSQTTSGKRTPLKKQKQASVEKNAVPELDKSTTGMEGSSTPDLKVGQLVWCSTGVKRNLNDTKEVKASKVRRAVAAHICEVFKPFEEYRLDYVAQGDMWDRRVRRHNIWTLEEYSSEVTFRHI
jgi:hypothetical protein